MFKRKLFVGFFSSSYFVFVFSNLAAINDVPKNNFEYLANIWLPMLFYSFYVFTIVCIYGIGISILIEIFLKKFNIKVKCLVSSVLHALFGALGGLIFLNLPSAIFGASVALLFFAIDELLQKYINLRKPLLILSFAPLIFALISFGFYHPYWNREDAKFTANQAVQFAVSSKGTYNSLFPDELNKVIETEIDGYTVTRSTDVEKLGSGDYKIKLIEKWHKTGENGERITNYHVQRKEGGTSLSSAGSSGDIIPYKH